MGWNWSSECKKAFEKINILTSYLSLMHFNPKLDIVVASDASDYGGGGGGAILHKLKDRRKKKQLLMLWGL